MKIIQGYYQLAVVSKGKTVKEGGFIPSKRGLLFAVYDGEKKMVVKLCITRGEARQWIKEQKETMRETSKHSFTGKAE